MSDLTGKKFIASYSGGKDSILAIYRAISAGMVPLKLIITYNTDQKRSWFHGIPEPLLAQVSDSLQIPIQLIKTSGDAYTDNFEAALIQAKQDGAEVCVFGDIDLDAHLEWCSARCHNTGLLPHFPLWKEERRKLVYEFIDSGFSSVITIVDTTRMPGSFVGQTLSRSVVDAIAETGADICGEEGEYHSFVYDGPLFQQPIDFVRGELLTIDKRIIMPLLR